MIREIEEAVVKASQIYPAVHQKPYLDGEIFGYNLAIDKACEWFEKNVGLVYNFNGDENTSTFVEDFREAMKGGEE